jgi:L-amino acid N-acyltransferase
VPIRHATPDDLLAITEIANALLLSTTYEWTDTPYSVDERAQWLEEQESADHPVLVATDEDQVVGWTSYGDFRDTRRWPGYRYTVEHTIHVLGSHWGRGIGRSLIIGLADHARLAGKRVLVAGIDSSNVRSIQFHANLGFIEVALMPGIGEKWGQRLDLVLMQYNLEPSLK